MQTHILSDERKAALNAGFAAAFGTQPARSWVQGPVMCCLSVPRAV